MTIAVATTLLDQVLMSNPSIVQLVVAGIVIGGVIGSIIARRISMSDASTCSGLPLWLVLRLFSWLGLLIWHRKALVSRQTGILKLPVWWRCLLGLRLVQSHFQVPLSPLPSFKERCPRADYSATETYD